MGDINHHCSVVRIGDYGILIEGASGTGKTSIALGLIETFKNNNVDAALVCDDQALLKIEDGYLVARTPSALIDKVEIRGFGIASIETTGFAKISLIVGLVADENIERMPEPETKELLGVCLPYLKVPIRHEALAIRIVKAWLAKHNTKRRL